MTNKALWKRRRVYVNRKEKWDIISFLKQKDYVMVNNDLGGGSFGKTVVLKDPYVDELFVAKK